MRPELAVAAAFMAALLAAEAAAPFPAVMTLNRSLPLKGALKYLKELDKARHNRSSLVDFPIWDTSDLEVAGLHFNLNLESISVNGQKLPINSSFTTPNAHETFVDTGTTLSYLAEGVYDLVVSAIAASVHPYVHPVGFNQNMTGSFDQPICYLLRSIDYSLFPTVVLHFKGGAAMKVGLEKYLLQEGEIDASPETF